MKTTTLYDFTLTAGGSQRIEADANFYKILTATGDVSITRNGGSTVKPMRAGRGERNVEFLSLTIKDLSGAPNSGTILVGDSDFIDDTIVLSSAINVRPEAATGVYKSNTPLAALTPDTVFTPGLNTGGAIILSASYWSGNTVAVPQGTFLSKSGAAPTNMIDGNPILQGIDASWSFAAAAALRIPQFVPAGEGLYFMNTVTENTALRHVRYKLL